jgi:hypothetical protein
METTVLREPFGFFQDMPQDERIQVPVRGEASLS